jgi:hypothetical protein
MSASVPFRTRHAGAGVQNRTHDEQLCQPRAPTRALALFPSEPGKQCGDLARDSGRVSYRCLDASRRASSASIAL